jgi:hypothetical protein
MEETTLFQPESLWKAVEIEGISIVLLGDFNPKIIQPSWLAGQDLIAKSEAEAADVKIITPDVSVFKLEWLTLEVTRERFSASTTQAAFFEVVRDLVVGTFSILRHTPARALGINRECHFRVSTVEKWHAFGDRLAPKEIWKPVLEKPGLNTLVLQALPAANHLGRVRVQIQPSVRVDPGVFCSINDHYAAEKDQGSAGCEMLINNLRDYWSASMQKSREIILKIIEESRR